MSKITNKDIKDFLLDRNYEDTIIFNNYDYANAFIGVTCDGNAVYDYNKMIECLVEEENMNEDDAIEWIEYNTIRAIPYISEGKKPIILCDKF